MAGINAVNEKFPDAGVPWNWGDEELYTISSSIRAALFPISIAANKADRASPEAWADLTKLVNENGGVLVPTSAEAELALRRASRAGLILHSPGNSNFEITEQGNAKLSNPQRKGLENISNSLNF